MVYISFYYTLLRYMHTFIACYYLRVAFDMNNEQMHLEMTFINKTNSELTWHSIFPITKVLFLIFFFWGGGGGYIRITVSVRLYFSLAHPIRNGWTDFDDTLYRCSIHHKHVH